MGTKSQSTVLCYVHDLHISRLFHPLPGLQYHRRSEYSFSLKRIPGDIYGSLPAESIARGP